MDNVYVTCVFTMFVDFATYLSTHDALVITAHVTARKPHASFSHFARAGPLYPPRVGERKWPFCTCGACGAWTTRRVRQTVDAVK